MEKVTVDHYYKQKTNKNINTLIEKFVISLIIGPQVHMFFTKLGCVYQTSHFFFGFMYDPSLHLNTSENSWKFDKVPITLQSKRKSIISVKILRMVENTSHRKRNFSFASSTIDELKALSFVWKTVRTKRKSNGTYHFTKKFPKTKKEYFHSYSSFLDVTEIRRENVPFDFFTLFPIFLM